MPKTLSTVIVILLTGVLNPFLLLSAPPCAEYKLLYSEEFSGTNVNSADWTCRTGRRTGPNMDGLNLEANVAVFGGQLHIATRQETINGKLVSTGGGLISRHNFGYGYYETLSKPFMAGHGVHSSFWQSGSTRPNNNIFEIDGYEIDAKSSIACHNLYLHLLPSPESGYDHAPWVHRANVPFKMNPDGSYLCGYEYTPDGVTFYSQGRNVARADWPELTAQQTVLLTALNGVSKVDGEPGETTFDYFRYYAKDYPGVNLLPNGSFEYNQGRAKPSAPIAWQISGDAAAIQILTGDAYDGQFKLRLGDGKRPFTVQLSQSLEFIRNGNYEFTAFTKIADSAPQAVLSVGDNGPEKFSLPISGTPVWTKILLTNIAVMNHAATVRISVHGVPGQWLELDDLRFFKPIPLGQTDVKPVPFKLLDDPIWSLACHEPLKFTGDAKFYFFDRNVGIGSGITVALTIKPTQRMNTCPISRMPQTGSSGWAIMITDDGKIIFRVGSRAEHEDIVAPVNYAPNGEMRVVCIFERKAAKIFLDGRLVALRTGLHCNTSDSTAPGRVGCVDYSIDAVGDVIMRAKAGNVPASGRFKNFIGTVRDVQIWNHSLSGKEVSATQK